MHRVLRRSVFPGDGPPVLAELYESVPETGAHGHDFMELAVVTNGRATHVCPAGRREIGAGSVLVLRPTDWHGYRDCHRLSVFNLYVGMEVFGRELSWFREDARLRQVIWRSERDARSPHGWTGTLDPAALHRVVDSLSAMTEPAGQDAGERAVRIGHLCRVLGETAAALTRSAGPSPDRLHPSVLTAVTMLEDDLAVDWSLPELAAAAHVSPPHLSRLFTANLGTSPMAYLGRLRAERTAALLIETDLPIAHIGRLVGWRDPNYLSRRFRQFFHLSPGQYRTRFHPGPG